MKLFWYCYYHQPTPPPFKSYVYWTTSDFIDVCLYKPATRSRNGGQELQPAPRWWAGATPGTRQWAGAATPEPERSLLSKDRYGKLVPEGGNGGRDWGRKGNMITLYGKKDLRYRVRKNAIYAARAVEVVMEIWNGNGNKVWEGWKTSLQSPSIYIPKNMWWTHTSQELQPLIKGLFVKCSRWMVDKKQRSQ